MSLAIKRRIIVAVCVLLAVALGRAAIQPWRDAKARALSAN
jgi:hypothetical protein